MHITAVKKSLSGIVLAGALLFSAAESYPADMQTPPIIEFNRIAVTPFLAGSRRPDLDKTRDQTLVCTIAQICEVDPLILPQAGPYLTRLTNQQLRQRFDSGIVPMDQVRDAYTQIVLEDRRDTPLSIAAKLGHLLDADYVVIGTAWRYRDRGAIEGIPDSPASVGFAVYLIHVDSGRRIWRGHFEGTQRQVLDNVLEAAKHIKMGLQWLSADELARYGMAQAFQNFPRNFRPAGARSAEPTEMTDKDENN